MHLSLMSSLQLPELLMEPLALNPEKNVLLKHENMKSLKSNILWHRLRCCDKNNTTNNTQ